MSKLIATIPILLLSPDLLSGLYIVTVPYFWKQTQFWVLSFCLLQIGEPIGFAVLSSIFTTKDLIGTYMPRLGHRQGQRYSCWNVLKEPRLNSPLIKNDLSIQYGKRR